MRQIAARVGAFLVVVALAGWPWQPIRRAFSSAYCATVGAGLGAVRFKDGTGHARVRPAAPTTARRPRENVTSDAEVELSLGGPAALPRLGVNLRRDAYLPLLLLIGAIALAPLRMRSKALGLLVGVPIVLAASLAALAALVGWVFAGGLGPPDAMASPALDLAVRMLLAPPGNRFSAPLVLAAVLILWRLRSERRFDRQRPSSPPSTGLASASTPSGLPPS